MPGSSPPRRGRGRLRCRRPGRRAPARHGHSAGSAARGSGPRQRPAARQTGGRRRRPRSTDRHSRWPCNARPARHLRPPPRPMRGQRRTRLPPRPWPAGRAPTESRPERPSRPRVRPSAGDEKCQSHQTLRTRRKLPLHLGRDFRRKPAKCKSAMAQRPWHGRAAPEDCCHRAINRMLGKIPPRHRQLFSKNLLMAGRMGSGGHSLLWSLAALCHKDAALGDE
jgi:hypothetical protein